MTPETPARTRAGIGARRAADPEPPAGTAPPPTVDVVVPVHNEQAALAPSVRSLRAHLAEHLPYTFRITIADNASSDGTPAIADGLAHEYDDVVVHHDERKGRGRALTAVWSASDAPVLAYTDVDLSTDLSALAPLVAPLVSGHSDIAIGTRLGRGAHVVRGAKREVISRCYNLLLHGALATRFSDAQCGFKAVRADVARALLPHVDDDDWFFDTELLVLAERADLRIHEVPVDWTDDPDSRVEIAATAVADLRGVARLLRGLASGSIPVHAIAEQLRDRGRGQRTSVEDSTLLRQAVRFAAVGVVSTLVYFFAFVALRAAVDAQAANLVALLGTAVANFAANRRYTFGVRGRSGAVRHQFQGFAVFAVSLTLTSGALFVLHSVHDPNALPELTILVAVNLSAAFLRFAMLRGWIFRRSRDGT